jgi:hypothetical protein
MTEKPGGYRIGAGRKSQWRSPTKMMRLPAQYEQQILEYARLLDSDLESNELLHNSESESNRFDEELQQRIDRVLLSIKPSERRAASKLFKKLITWGV